MGIIFKRNEKTKINDLVNRAFKGIKLEGIETEVTLAKEFLRRIFGKIASDKKTGSPELCDIMIDLLLNEEAQVDVNEFAEITTQAIEKLVDELGTNKKLAESAASININQDLLVGIMNVIGDRLDHPVSKVYSQKLSLYLQCKEIFERDKNQEGDLYTEPLCDQLLEAIKYSFYNSKTPDDAEECMLKAAEDAGRTDQSGKLEKDVQYAIDMAKNKFAGKIVGDIVQKLNRNHNVSQ